MKKLLCRIMVFPSIFIGILGFPLSLSGETITIEKEHSKFYQAGSVLDVGEVLDFDSMQETVVDSITVSYNMVFSNLEADWLIDGMAFIHMDMPKGTHKSIALDISRRLPVRIEVKFSGSSGQVQIVSIKAVVEHGNEVKAEHDDEDHTALLSSLIKVNPATSRKDYGLAQNVKKEIVRQIIDNNLMDRETIRRNMTEGNEISILIKGDHVSLSGRVDGNVDQALFHKKVEAAVSNVISGSRITGIQLKRFTIKTTPYTLRDNQYTLTVPTEKPEGLDFLPESAEYRSGSLFVRVHNNGTENFEGTPTQRFSMALQWLSKEGKSLAVSPVLTLDSRNHPIPAGESREVRFFSDFGNYFFYNPPVGKDAEVLRILVDSQDSILETNEENNHFDMPRLYPDLVVYHGRPVILRPDLLKFTLANIGQTEMTDPLRVGLQWLDKNELPLNTSAEIVFAEGLKAGRYSGSAIAGSGSYAVFQSGDYSQAKDYIFNRPSGAVKIRITLDPGNRLEELNEENNVKSAELMPGGVDLSIESAQFRAGDLFTLVRNHGTEDFSGTSALTMSMALQWLSEEGKSLAVSPVLTLDSRNHPIPAGESREVRFFSDFGNYFFYNPPIGDEARTLRVLVDSQDVIMESVEEDNHFDISNFKPDLIIYKESPIILRPDLLKFTLANIGQTIVDGGVEIELQWLDGNNEFVGASCIFYDMQTLIPGRYHGSSIAGKGSWAVIESTDYPETDAYIRNRPEGTTKLRIRLDPNRRIDELNETNNSHLIE